MGDFAKTVGVAAIVAALTFVSKAEADPPTEWVVAGDGVPKPFIVVPRGGESDLGERAGWRCFAKVETSTRDDGKNVDTATVRCQSGTVGVRTQAKQVDGEPLVDPTSLQITNAAGDKPVRTLVFGPRSPKH